MTTSYNSYGVLGCLICNILRREEVEVRGSKYTRKHVVLSVNGNYGSVDLLLQASAIINGAFELVDKISSSAHDRCHKMNRVNEFITDQKVQNRELYFHIVYDLFVNSQSKYS